MDRKGIGVGGAIIAVALIMAGALAGSMWYFNAQSQEKVETEMANVNEWGIDAKVRFGRELTVDAYLVKEKPEYWGDYEDFDPTDYIEDEYKLGVDYFKQSASTAEKVTFPELESGDYYLYMTADTNNDDTYEVFTKVTMPEEIQQAKAEDSNYVYTLATSNVFDFQGSFSNPSPIIYEDETLDMAKVDGSAYKPSDTGTYDVTWEMTEDLDDIILLGDAKVNFLMNADTFEFDEVKVSIPKADWSKTFDYDGDEVSDTETNSYTLGESDSPIKVSGDLVLKAEFKGVDTSTLNSSGAKADIATFTIEDIDEGTADRTTSFTAKALDTGL